MDSSLIEDSQASLSFSNVDEPLEDDLDAIDSSRARVEGGKWGRPSVYVLAFEAMINTVTEKEVHLLSESETRLILALRALTYNARYCLFRLILRKSDTWHTVASMKSYEKEVDSQGILDAIEELCKPIQQIIEDCPPSQQISEASSSYEGSQESSQVPQPPVSSSQSSGPEVIDLTGDTDDEDTKPSNVKAEADPPTFNRNQSDKPADLKPSLDNLADIEWNTDFDWFCESDTNMTLDEALNKLTVDQLRDLVKAMKVKPAKNNKPEMIFALRSHAVTQSVLDFNAKGKGKGKGKAPRPGTPTDGFRQSKLPFPHQKSGKGGTCRQSQEKRLMDMALQKLGRSVRVNTNLYWFVVRLNVIYERSMDYPKSFLVPSLLTSFKKRAYPLYQYTRDPTIWGSREALLDYIEALRLEAALEKELDSRLEPDLRTPIPGSGGRRSMTLATPAPRARTTSLRTPLRSSSQALGAENSACKKEEPADPVLPTAEEEEKQGREDAKRQRALRIRALFVESILPRWQGFVAAKANQPTPPRTPGLERFEPGYVFTRICSRVLEHLAYLKEREEELMVLEALLGQRCWRRGKRARWYERRAIILSRYLCFETLEDGKKIWKREATYRAMEGVREALRDEDVGIVYRPGFVRRLRKLEKRLKLPPEECCQCDAELTDKIPKTFCAAVRLYTSASALKLDPQGRPLKDDPSVKTYFPSVGKSAKADKENMPQAHSPPPKPKWKGKSLWLGKSGEEVNVEQRALEFYASQGFKGFHSETRVVTTIFALLFWEILFTHIPGAFETPHQIAPLDLATDSFYRARKDMIEARLEELRIPGRAAEILAERDDEPRPLNTWCVGVRWDICEKQDLVEIVNCLTGETLPIVCRILCDDYSGRSSGVPDLIVWDPVRLICKFVEVKGPGDRPQENQKLWFDTLMGAGAQVELCHVYDVNKPPNMKKPKKSRQPKRTVKADPESEEPFEEDPASEAEASFDQTVNSDAEYWDSLPDVEASVEETDQLRRKRQRSPSLSDMLPLSTPLPSGTQVPTIVGAPKKRKRISV